MMYGYTKLGLENLPLGSDNLVECLLFGALISATDPGTFHNGHVHLLLLLLLLLLLPLAAPSLLFKLLPLLLLLLLLPPPLLAAAASAVTLSVIPYVYSM